MNKPTENDLTEAIVKAARKAISKLFSEYLENFYYCSLITNEEGSSPILVAWSKEALERVLLEENDPENALLEIKWSYADSPYFAYGEEYFDKVKKLFSDRPNMRYEMSGHDWNNELQVRIEAMEKAMRQLDNEGLFGRGDERLDIVINAEIMPPDNDNTKRGLRLNPIEALTDWLVEAAE